MKHLLIATIASFSIFFNLNAAESGTTREVVVQKFTQADGTKAWRLELKITTRDSSGVARIDYATPTAGQFMELIKQRPELVPAIKEAFEENKDPRESLAKMDSNEELTVAYKPEVLKKIATGFNSSVFSPTPLAPAVANGGGQNTNSKSVDEEKLKELLARMDTDLKGSAATSKDIQTLYKAVAELLADKRCGFERAESIQKFQSKGLGATVKNPIEIDPNSNDIGGGDLTFHFPKDSQKGPVKLHWDAEHFTEMSIKDWLYGHPNGASNGHTGFYPQLAAKGICGNPTSAPEEPPVSSTPNNNLDHLREKDRESIDQKKLSDLLGRKDTDLKENAAKAKDIRSLYDALAVLLADKRCGFSRAESKQTYQSRSITTTKPEPIKIDPNSTDIGGGNITFYPSDNKSKAVTLSWDAEHFTEMSVKDWLYGHPNGASNGHSGFYRQLAILKLCGLNDGQYPNHLNRTH